MTVSRTTTVVFGALAWLAAAGATGVLYVKGAGIANLAAAQVANGACADADAAIARVAPLAKGEVAAMMVAKAPAPMPELVFEGPGGATKHLADYRGRTVLLNLWATWCIPCREEMPALDRLQREAGGEAFEVVAVNIDTTRLDRRQAFLEKLGVKSLAFYSDPKAEVFQVLRAAGKIEGLPTTWLVGKDGCEIAVMAAKADWASPDAMALVKAALP